MYKESPTVFNVITHQLTIYRTRRSQFLSSSVTLFHLYNLDFDSISTIIDYYFHYEAICDLYNLGHLPHTLASHGC